MTVTLVIDRHPPLSPNRTMRMNRWQRGQHNRDWQAEVVVAWMTAGRPRFERVRLRITLYSRGDRRITDPDNAVGAVKPIIDGLKGRAFPDDTSRHVVELAAVAAVDNARPRVEIEIEEVV